MFAVGGHERVHITTPNQQFAPLTHYAEWRILPHLATETLLKALRLSRIAIPFRVAVLRLPGFHST